MEEHALLSPSAAHRWMNCTASARLEASIGDSGSEYAAEGTLAHKIAATKLLGAPLSGNGIISEEIHENTDYYKAVVLNKYEQAKRVTPDAKLLVEQRLDLTAFIPEAFGTADAIIIADDLIEVIDFKYGKGVKVSACNNPQMMIYALGAYRMFGFEYDIHHVKMTIVQPRIDNLSEYEISIAMLAAWAEDILLPKANEAYRGDGKAIPGEWCQFCKVKPRCRALAKKCEESCGGLPNARLLSAEEIAGLLPKLPLIRTWVSGLEEYALTRAMGGERYNGYKLVEGRSVRKITDPDKVADRLRREGYLEDEIYKPQELRTITDLERLVGKKKFQSDYSQWVDKPAGKPTLVPLDDKRKEISPAAYDFSGINI